MTDLSDTIPAEMRNDKVALIYESNVKTNVAVNTPFGLTDRKEVIKIVQQGGCWGPIKCSNTVDTVGKECKLENKYVYKYKERWSNDSVTVPPLAFIDDLLAISKAGIDSMESNVYLTTKVQLKRMNFNTGSKTKKSKCEVMHVGRSKEKSVELRANDKVMENVTKISYLGDKVSQTGKHNSNIKARIGKGLGIISEIFSILDNVSFGPYFFKIAVLFITANAGTT